MVLILAKRDLSIKYAQTGLGVLWTILQPLTGLFIFAFFFNQIIKLPNIPESGYAIFAFTGMTAWYFFSYIVYQSSTSLTSSQDLTQKISFPKIILPLSKVIVGLADLGISMVLLIILMFFKGVFPIWHILFLPAFVVLNMLVGLSVSIWLSALTVRFRDLQHIVPYVINFGIWLTPVFFPATLIPGKWSWMLYFNPMAGIVEGYRWCLWSDWAYNPNYFIGIGLTVIVLVAGVYYFIRSEDQMVDVL